MQILVKDNSLDYVADEDGHTEPGSGFGRGSS